MYYCLILYSYTHCTFEQMGVQAICTYEQVFRIAEQIDTKKGSIAAPPTKINYTTTEHSSVYRSPLQRQIVYFVYHHQRPFYRMSAMLHSC